MAFIWDGISYGALAWLYVKNLKSCSISDDRVCRTKLKEALSWLFETICHLMHTKKSTLKSANKPYSAASHPPKCPYPVPLLSSPLVSFPPSSSPTSISSRPVPQRLDSFPFSAQTKLLSQCGYRLSE